MRSGEDVSVQGMLETTIKEIRENQWLGAHRDEIFKEYEVVRNRGLITFMENAGTSRVFDDLRRSFSKLLAVYHNHEDWCSERAIFDMGMVESTPVWFYKTNSSSFGWGYVSGAGVVRKPILMPCVRTQEVYL